MLTRWLTFAAFLVASADPQRAAPGQGTLNIAPTRRVGGHPGVALTLNCGDAECTGMVQLWHTPFGNLQTQDLHGKLDPIFIHHNGSLVVPYSSGLHSGLYYCILRHKEGTTLWPYELCFGSDDPESREQGERKQGNDLDALRFRRDARSEEEEQVSERQFAGAVAASVLLTFVVGFTAGALTRTHVLRCLGVITAWLQSLWQRRRQADTLGSGPEVTMTTVPPMYDNQAFRTENVTMEMTILSTASSPPAKPQRSFRHKQEEHLEATAYLEGCDYVTEEERGMEEEGRSLREKNKGFEVEAKEEEEEEEEREFSGFYLLGEDGGSQTETDEKHSEHGEETGGREEKEDEEEDRGREEAAGNNKEKGSDEKWDREGGWKEEKGEDGEEKRGEDICRDSQQSSTDTDDEDTGSKKQEDTVENGIMRGGDGGRGASSSCPRCPAHRSRVIRLYQYDEDGQRYCHLADPCPNDPGPPPRLKQRSVSLTRLNAIMAAASLDGRETGGHERGERPYFHMEI